MISFRRCSRTFIFSSPPAHAASRLIALSGALCFALSAQAIPLEFDGGKMYLVDGNLYGTTSKLYQIVSVDSATGHANVSFIDDLGPNLGSKVFTAAVAPDNPNRVYVLSASTAKLGAYHVGAPSNQLQILGNTDFSTASSSWATLGDFDPEGRFYAAANNDEMKLLDPSSADGSNVPTLWKGASGIDLLGAGLAFKPDGDVIVYSNATHRFYRYDNPLPTDTSQNGTTVTGAAIAVTGLGPLPNYADIEIGTFMGLPSLFAMSRLQLDRFSFTASGDLVFEESYTWYDAATNTNREFATGDLALWQASVPTPPVPEPGAVPTLFVLACAAMGALARD